MRQLHLLCCLLGVFITAWSKEISFEDIAQGRGPRVVEQGHKSECVTEKEWAACIDDDWGPKCPSGCRIQGLLSQTDRDIAQRIDRIRKFLEENRNRYKSTDQFTKQTYDYIREQLVLDSGNDNKYVNLADQLRRRIVDLKQKIDNQLSVLIVLKDKIREQVDTMQALEVDIDIKIRSCKGSCASAFVYNVNTESYVTLEKQISQIENINLQRVENANSMRIVKMRPMRGEETVSSVYKSTLATEGGEKSIFGNVEQLRLSLETADYEIKHGSPEVSATPGVGSGSVSMGSSSGDKVIAKQTSITEESTPGSSVTTHTKVLTCTKTIKKRIVYTKDGPVETVEMTGGSPECDHLESLGTDDALHSSVKEGKGDSGSFTTTVSGTSGGVDGISDRFPDLHSFFNKHSSSSTSTKEVRGGGGGSTVVTTSTRELPDHSRVKTVVHSDLGRGDGDFESHFGEEDFGAFRTETVFPVDSQKHDGKGSSSYSKTTVVSSSSSKGGHFSEQKSRRIRDIQARSLKKG